MSLNFGTNCENVVCPVFGVYRIRIEALLIPAGVAFVKNDK
jgi:hypothetical protein